MEFAPLLLEQGGIGDFLYHRVLECEDGALRFLDAIHNPGVLQCPQRVCQRLAVAWKYVENAFIIELPPEDGGNLGDTLGGTEAIKEIEAALAKGPRRGPKPEVEEDAVVEEQAA